MGPSITQSTFQEAMTTVNQLVSQQCVNICFNSGNTIDVTVSGGATVNDIDIGEKCLIKGCSCTLKAALTNEVVNDLITKDKATQVQLSGPMTLLSDLITGGQKVDQEEYQVIVNAITQEINSVCQNQAGSTDNHYNVDVSGEGTYVSTININNTATITKTDCIMNNIIKSSITNSESASNTASQFEAGIFGLLIIGFIVIMIMIMIIPIEFLNEFFKLTEKVGEGVLHGVEAVGSGIEDTAKEAGSVISGPKMGKGVAMPPVGINIQVPENPTGEGANAVA